MTMPARRDIEAGVRPGPADARYGPTSEVLFVGQGANPNSYHRAFLPATTLGFDWCAVLDEPPNLRPFPGLVGDQGLPDLDAYRIVVVEQARHPNWEPVIEDLRAAGVKVMFRVR